MVVHGAMRKALILLLAAGAVSCSKKDSKKDDTTSSGGLPDSIRPAEGQSAMAKTNEIALALISDVASLPAYNLATTFHKGSQNFAAFTIDTAEKWNSQVTFNHFGANCTQSYCGTPRYYVREAMNPDGEFTPVSKMNESLNMLCAFGQVLSADQLDAVGLPKAMAETEMTMDAARRERIETNCGMEVQGEFNFKFAVTDLTSGDFSKKIRIVTDGEHAEDMTYYMSLTAAGVRFLQSKIDPENDKVRERIQFSYAPDAGKFNFEYVSNKYGDTFEDKSFNQFRTAIDEKTKEARFTSVMGSSPEENLTFLAVSGNLDAEDTGGAFFYRIADQSGVENQFVCFNKSNGNFVNNTGCTENADNNRKVTFNPDSKSFSSLAALNKDSAKWTIDENTPALKFNVDDITSEEF